MTNDAVVTLSNICKNYTLGKTQIQALKDITLVAGKEDFLVIAGPSGSGKTTLLNIIGLIDEPTTGKIQFGQKEINGKNVNSFYQYRRDKLGYIFQTFNLIPVLSVYENVEYPLILQNVPYSKRREQVETILEKVGLSDRKKHKPNELSGGQMQRTSIARAVVKNPEIVLADEPTANLDSKTGEDIIRLMEKLNQEDGATFIFSSHDPKIIEKGQQIIKLKDGKIIDSVS